MGTWSPLRNAVEVGDVPAARALLESGEDVNGLHDNEPGRQFSLLHHAVDAELDTRSKDGLRPYTEMVELLLAFGADLSARSYNGETPAEMARFDPVLSEVIERERLRRLGQ